MDAFVEFIPFGSAMSALECPHQKKVLLSMESAAFYHRMISGVSDYDIYGSTCLETDVPVPYFSWDEYDFLAPLEQKTAKAMAAAFISNCGDSSGRLGIMQDLMKYGVTIDSYGSCLNNKAVHGAGRGGDWSGTKIHLLKTYKFAIAMENSFAEGYITEKLFQPFVAGAIPIHLGVKDVHRYGPATKSIISVHDFSTTKELADYIIAVNNNETLYDEYIRWKREGPSKQFIALVDLARVHSECRLCIRVGDLYRRENRVSALGPYYVEDNKFFTKYKNNIKLTLYTRSRGTFYFRRIYLTELTIFDLLTKIDERYANAQVQGEIYSIYTIPKDLKLREPKINIVYDEDVIALKDNSEIEIIWIASPKQRKIII